MPSDGNDLVPGTDVIRELMIPKNFRVIEGSRVSKRGASASPGNTDSDKCSDVVDFGGTVLRSQRRSKVACLNTSPDIIVGDSAAVSLDDTADDPVVPAVCADTVLSISSEEDGISWFQPKRGKPARKGKVSVTKSKIPEGKPCTYRSDSEDRVSLLFDDTVGPPDMVVM